MRKLLAALFLCAFALGQDEGRDVPDERPILFVRWERTAQRANIYLAAWQALEPHHGMPPRLRLKDLNRDEEKAKAFFAAHEDARLVIAMDDHSAMSARRLLPKTPVLSAGFSSKATVSTWVSRASIAQLIKLFHPDVRAVAVTGRGRGGKVFGLGAPEGDQLPGLRVRVCRSAREAEGCDLTWLPEHGRQGVVVLGGPGGRRAAWWELPAPYISTSDLWQQEVTLQVLPDAESVGRKLAAVALGVLRDGKELPKEPLTVSRLRVTIDLQAARKAGYEVPLAALARADAVRRAR